MPPKTRTRSKRAKHVKHKAKNDNKRVRTNLKKKQRTHLVRKKKPIVDFSKLSYETLLEIKQHYQINQETQDVQELSQLILAKFLKQAINEEKVIKDFLNFSKEY
ncbi:histone deacetylase complex subunit sap30l [Anaeramoeba flamelloides]|uniref:Histone deacetylase complex subunit sap30l n=1 Tax=Anaeramoeba flamelloides TaxID=1746091 RepID=A0AAV7ZXB4_9EUKA|nr:histone deacetylase complex subunit sap30l [Anaeramoeba flamelloides]